jgi:hypothetical protein
MVTEIKECCSCGKAFTFETSKCSQIIVKGGQKESVIIFLPRCPHCESMNKMEMPWESYGNVDY